uniref:Uncharacterized protein n=1 Tax=Sphaerodactylus townsendi TaxID=933632 RepID=A0ACB8F6S2_9SAUR
MCKQGNKQMLSLAVSNGFSEHRTNASLAAAGYCRRLQSNVLYVGQQIFFSPTSRLSCKLHDLAKSFSCAIILSRGPTISSSVVRCTVNLLQIKTNMNIAKGYPPLLNMKRTIVGHLFLDPLGGKIDREKNVKIKGS